MPGCKVSAPESIAPQKISMVLAVVVKVKLTVFWRCPTTVELLVVVLPLLVLGDVPVIPEIGNAMQDSPPPDDPCVQVKVVDPVAVAMA